MDPARVEVYPKGFGFYEIIVIDNLFEIGPWIRFGLERAKRKASYELWQWLITQKEIPGTEFDPVFIYTQKIGEK